MENAKNLNLLLTHAINHDKWSTGDHQFPRSFHAAFTAELRIALKYLDTGKDAVNQCVCPGGTVFAYIFVS